MVFWCIPTIMTIQQRGYGPRKMKETVLIKKGCGNGKGQ